MNISRQLFATFIFLASVLVIFQLYEIDILLQNYFYDAAAASGARWAVDAGNKDQALIFHKLLKLPLVSTGSAVFALLVYSFSTGRLAHLRPGLMVVFLSVLIVPLIISSAKYATNIYCPSQLMMYGGKYPHIRTFDAYPADFIQAVRGRCYPAAHASAGFALMSLYFLFTRRSYKIAGLLAGFTLGWIMGLYQMLKGAHFLSHTLVTMCCSWLIILLCHVVVSKIDRSKHA